jgi:hypothetical protein
LEVSLFKSFRSTCVAAALLAICAVSGAQSAPGAVGGTWTPLVHQPPVALGTSLLLLDGSVMSQQYLTNHWWRLRPDASGSYANGTWSPLPDMRADYAPLYYASAVLKDGRVVVIGGEYNFGSAVWTNLGAIFDPVANTWAPLSAPPGWTNMGDAQCTVLPNGKFMVADSTAFHTAILDPTTMAWTAGGITGKSEANFDEEGWELLPDGTILTLDVFTNPTIGEKYIISGDTWVPAGTTGQLMTGNSFGYEIGPAVLRFDGTVFATGANGLNAKYTPPATHLIQELGPLLQASPQAWARTMHRHVF